MNRARNVVYAMVVVGWVPAAAAYAQISGIQLTSESYHVWGNLDGRYAPPEPGGVSIPCHESFDFPASTPISGGVDAELEQGFAWAQAATGPLSLSVSAWVYGGYANANAWGEWEFIPLARSLHLSFDWYETLCGLWYTDPYSLNLTDSTTGDTLLSLSGTGADYWHPSQNPADCFFTVDPTHVYTFQMSLRCTANDDHHSSTFAPSLTPEASTLCLLGFGGLTLLRRRGSRRTEFCEF